ncbi:MAG: hypothetical protein WBP61_10790, partial [Nocardioides sp.]
MAGPQETRLIQAVTNGQPGNIQARAFEWSECARMLGEVADALAKESMPTPVGEAGTRTAEAMNSAFARSAEAMRKRADKLRDGTRALEDAAEVLEEAKRARDVDLGPDTSGRRPTLTPHPHPNSPAGLKAQQEHNADVAAFEAEQARRERVAKQHADQMDVVYARSADTMREIHGEPPPPPPPPDYAGGSGGSRGGGATGAGTSGAAGGG